VNVKREVEESKFVQGKSKHRRNELHAIPLLVGVDRECGALNLFKSSVDYHDKQHTWREQDNELKAL
jgi:hypothetical protein